MKKCKRIERDFIPFLQGELDSVGKRAVESHIASCARCRDDLEELKQVLEQADSLHGRFTRDLDSVDWDILPARITARVFDGEGSPMRNRRPRFRPFILQPKFRPLLAGILVGIVVGSLSTVVFFQSVRNRGPARPDFSLSPEMLDRVEVEIARRETIDYLDQSQHLLLDLAQANSPEAAHLWSRGFSAQKAKNLLSKKKYINQQIDRVGIAKAKAICDQIEVLFYELTQMTDDLSEKEFRQIQNFIDEKQLLLKINIVKKELKKNDI